METQETQEDLLKQLKLQNKKLLRENSRLQKECDVLTDMNDKISRTQLFFHRDNQRQLCYNNQLLKTMPYILVMVDENLKTVMASDVFFQKSGVSRDAVKEGMPLTEAFSRILPEDEMDSFLRQCEGVVESQGTDSYLLTCRGEEKDRFYQVDISYYLAQNEDAKGLCIILSDMTEIVEAKRRAENADKAKSSFLASMSHEIRTPINAVLGMNEMILRNAEDPSILEYSSNIRAAGRTLLSLINSILDFSKIEEGKMEIIPVEYETASFIGNLVVSVSERARQKGLELSVEVDPELPSGMVGDDVRLSQVIANLLTNAVKYTEKGSVSFCIRGGERSNGEITLEVSVKDTGIGIKQEELPKLFESFERLDEVRNRNIEGTGLGMSIVTRLLEMMGSRLKVESVYGQGSVFSFALRQKIADETPIGDYTLQTDAAQRPAGGETLRAPDSRILVVDDNEMNLKVAKNLFKLFDITPELVDSGFEAIRLLREGARYHMIFLDHMMPKMDGIEALKLIQEEALLPADSSVIALTANAINGAKELYLSAGFHDYLSKPIEVLELEQLLRKYLPKELCSDRVKDEKTDTHSDGVSALSAAGFDTEAGLRYAAGDRDFYLELAAGFSEACDDKLPAIRADFQREDWEDYQILVHALKSTARQIGAMELSDLALKQELAAKEKDEETIRAGVAELLRRYEEVCSRIRSVLASEGPGQPTEVSEEMPFEIVEEMPLEIIEEMPPEMADDTAKKPDVRGILSEAKERIGRYEAESAEELLKPLSALAAEELSAMLPAGISGTDFSEALRGILEALSDFDIISAKKRSDALLQAIGA
ncbi:MAG: response regulator [Lachnospiraceae bacterium]|nr:response regulator [Lachnospiraceae bacterium]